MIMIHRERKIKNEKKNNIIQETNKSTYNIKLENIKKMINYLKSQNKK